MHFSIKYVGYYNIASGRQRETQTQSWDDAIGVKLTSLQVTVWQYPSQECSHNELALNVCSSHPSWSRGYLPQLKDTRVVCVLPVLFSEIGIPGR
jgi:hypothetical protein